ncbi:hypothetical protein ABIQ69_06185 [Agromyces sp. G08B096]|uniref:Uncharacterized protein n=1 Tax=Agromyces sp. G08B096 TaxID=3156399 RepID=A0AAU7WCR1_9MICO
MPRRRAVTRTRCLAASVVVAAVSVTAGCAVAAEPDGAVPGEITASVLQSRQDVVDGRLVVQVDNGADTTLVIDRLTVASAGLEDELELQGPKRVPPGRSVAYRMDLPGPTCDEVVADPPSIVIEAQLGDASVAGRVPATDPYDTIARVQHTGCLAAAVEEIVAITPPERLRSTGSGTERRAVLDLAVAPVAGAEGSVEVHQVLGTTLLSAEGGLDWPVTATIEGGGSASTIELPVRPARCDPHAGAEDKRGTIIPIEVTTSDGWSGLYEVRSGPALKQDLFDYFTERCGLPSS